MLHEEEESGMRMLECSDYQTYLRIPHLQRIREAMIWLAGERRQLCKSDDNLEVHHASGGGCLGAERPPRYYILKEAIRAAPPDGVDQGEGLEPASLIYQRWEEYQRWRAEAMAERGKN